MQTPNWAKFPARTGWSWEQEELLTTSRALKVGGGHRPGYNS